MRSLYLATFLTFSNIAFGENAEQGVFVKPRPDLRGAAPEIVRMILGENEKTPVVDISPEGPTMLVLPGQSNIVRCVNTSSVVALAEGQGETVQTKDQVWYTEVVFFVNPDSVTAENVDKILSSRVAVICSYEIEGKTYRRQVKFKVNDRKRHAVVFFEREEDHQFDEYKRQRQVRPGRLQISGVKSNQAVPMPTFRETDRTAFTRVTVKGKAP